jgi:hypothetical protein
MKKYNNRFLVWFAVVAVVVFIVGVGLDEWKASAPGGSLVESDRATSDGGDEVVANAAEGYYFSMPTNWYVERGADSEFAVYPDYDPADASSSPAQCKIEISAITLALDSGPITETGLSDWVTQILHADPTANIAEISRTPMVVGGTPALEWRGVLNNVTTTLVYAEAPAGTGAVGSNNKIFEIAPSTLSEASDADNDSCDLDLQALVANFKFGAYEP